MMFLQFFIWGAWYVTVGNYMAANGMGDNIFWAYTVGPIAAIISPFFLGMVADRFFATQRILGALHVAGGLALAVAPMFTPSKATPDASPWPFIFFLLVHMLCYMPTLGLTNTLAFHHLPNREKQFPVVRVFGTAGWIVANITVSKGLNADKSIEMFYLAGASALLLGVISFFLPHTPAPAKGKKISPRDILGLDSLVLMKKRSFAVFIISSFLICIPLAAYYNYAPVYADAAGFRNVAYAMSFGQMAEVLFMVLMPLFFRALGVKWMLLVGMLAWVVRYGLFAAAATDGILWMIFTGFLLHGICYDFFFVTGFIYVDQAANEKIRGQAQGFLVLITQGLGMLIGAQLMGRIVNANKAPNFDELTAKAESLRIRADQLTGPEAQKLWHQATELLLDAHNWQTIWLIPCLMAAAILIAFFALFKQPARETDTPTT
ncbi:MAG TPA: MFS transporter [Phycisphaerales bacterium]|nr:MFS transporter [Phycisphaerales bacterium]